MQRRERPLVSGVNAGVVLDEQSGYVYVLEDKTRNQVKFTLQTKKKANAELQLALAD